MKLLITSSILAMLMTVQPSPARALRALSRHTSDPP